MSLSGASLPLLGFLHQVRELSHPVGNAPFKLRRALLDQLLRARPGQACALSDAGASSGNLFESPVKPEHRFAEGHLTERMPVRGEDDMARLAVSFNDMAESLHRQITQLEEFGNLQRRFTSDVSHELRTPLTTTARTSTPRCDGPPS
jgi:signal transduction histidine kinase